MRFSEARFRTSSSFCVHEVVAPDREPEFTDIDAEIDRIVWEV